MMMMLMVLAVVVVLLLSGDDDDDDYENDDDGDDNRVLLGLGWLPSVRKTSDTEPMLFPAPSTIFLLFGNFMEASV